MSAKKASGKSAKAKESSPEQLDMEMRVTSPVSWMTLSTLGVLIGGAIVFSVLGSMPVRVDGEGMLLRGGSVGAVQTISAGTVKSIEVKPGDSVAAGQVVAYLDLPDLESQIRQAEFRVRELEAGAQGLIGGSRGLIDGYRREIAAAQGSLKRCEELRQKGLRTKRECDQSQSQIQQLRAQIQQIEQQMSGQNSQIAAERGRLAQLRDKLESDSVVRSVSAGQVASVLVSPGQVISGGTKVITLQAEEAPFEVVAYVPFAEGKKIKKGHEVRVQPSTVGRETYGYMKARVKEVSSQPVSYEKVKTTFNNDQLAQKFARDSPFEVFVEPEVDERGQFVWSKGEGPEAELEGNTPVSAEIIIDRKKPYTYVIPTVNNRGPRSRQASEQASNQASDEASDQASEASEQASDQTTD